MRMNYRVLISCLLSTLLVACSGVNLPALTKYQLLGINTKAMEGKSRGTSILVNQPTATAGFQTNQMRYAKKPYEIASFSKNVWMATPADMIYPLVMESLQNTRHFGAVEGVPFTALTDYTLDVKLLKLLQNFVEKPSRIELIIKATVSNSSHRILASKTFYQKVITPQDNPYGGVLAANKATAVVMQQLAKFTVAATS